MSVDQVAVNSAAILGDPRVPARLWRCVEADENGCWIWSGVLNGSGYGKISSPEDRTRALMTHRVVYESLIGPIPPELEIDHLCRVRRCCNPDHLEPVTHWENVMRSTNPVRLNPTKTHCPSGHPYSGDNLHMTRSGDRKCRACNRDRYRALVAAGDPAWRQRKREVDAAYKVRRRAKLEAA